MTTHPWQSGPTEIIEFAIGLLESKSDTHKQIAFILLDMGVETLFKTILISPDDIKGREESYTKRKEYVASNNFHKLIEGVMKNSNSEITDIDFQHIKHFHDLRNKLYHDGNGITITNTQLQDYVNISKRLLQELLGVKIDEHLTNNDEKNELIQQIMHKNSVLDNIIKNLKENLKMLTEHINAQFLLPSFDRQYKEWREVCNHFWLKYQILNSNYDDEAVKNYNNAHFRESIKNELIFYDKMPKAIKELQKEYNVTDIAIFSLSHVDDQIELLMLIAAFVYSFDGYEAGRINALYRVNSKYLFKVYGPLESRDLETLNKILHEQNYVENELLKIQNFIEKKATLL